MLGACPLTTVFFRAAVCAEMLGASLDPSSGGEHVHVHVMRVHVRVCVRECRWHVRVRVVGNWAKRIRPAAG